MLDDIDGIADVLLAEALPLDRIGPPQRAERLMAQLTDDCFAFGGPLLPVDDAERLIAERVAPVAEMRDGGAARRRGAACSPRTSSRRSICRRSTIPRSTATRCATPISTRDGETRLAIVDRVAAGHAATHALKAGEAIRIFTGAPMPAGADTVFMQEDCRVDGERRGRAAGLEARRQPPACRRGRARRRGRAAGRPAACRAACCARGGARPHRA